MISKCLYNLFLVVERTNSGLVLVICNVTHVINRAVLVESCLNSFVIRQSVTGRITLAGFSDLQCVVFVTTVDSVLYLPN